MRIGIDIRCLLEGRKTGVDEYTVNILENIFTHDTENEYVLFLNSFKKTIGIPWTKKYPNVHLKSYRYPNKILNFLFWYFGAPKIDRLIGGVDVFFMPNIIFGSVSRRAKLLLTIHDLSFEHLPETFSWKRRLWHLFINPRKMCHAATRILAVSESTKNDIVKFYHIDPQKISVVPSAVSDNFTVLDRNDPEFLRIKEKYNLPYYYILYLGAIEPRKNIAGIVRAYTQLRKLHHPEIDKYKLVIAGAKGWKEEGLLTEIKKSPFKEDILKIGFISPEEKPYLYNLASLFVYPSFFEGFGFPPLEAMSCGVPVITSNNSSLPEIVGDAGILIDPEKPDELWKAMREVILNKELRNMLRSKGLDRAKQFSWRKAAEEFLEIVDRLEK